MITTYTGRTVNVLRPKIDDIDIEDIAHALALINRFNGHSAFPLSVAQHSVYVSRLSAPGYELQGLLHDAAEAYIGDMTKWLKMVPEMAAFRKAEEELEYVIAAKFHIDPQPWHHSVSRADELMVRFEARKAFGPDFEFGGMAHRYPPLTKIEIAAIGEWDPMKWTTAKDLFLKRYKELVSRRG